MQADKYTIELYSRQGLLIADITRLATNVAFTLQRNTAEQLSFSLDINAFEALCAEIGINPTSILSPYQTDVKVKRNGEYLFGTQVGDITGTLGETTGTIDVRCFGYFNLLIDRYLTVSYADIDATDIAWNLIDMTQSQTNGDLGITYGPNQTTTRDRVRNYERQNVRDAIYNLTKLIDGNFDFEITHDKKWNTYAQIGSDKSSELEFIYPGNITGITVTRNGLALFNEIIGVGSGFGSEALESIQEDNDSQLNYGLHQKVVSFNSVSQQDTLDQNTEAELSLRKDLLELPSFSVNGEDFNLNDIHIGDRVTLRIQQHPFFNTVDGIYRIEKIEVNIDENEAEEIKITFDNYNVDQQPAEEAEE